MKVFISVFTILLFLVNKILSMHLQPSFDRHIENVTVVVGNTALLSCFINNLGDHKVKKNEFFFAII